jgi:hypothetical protein
MGPRYSSLLSCQSTHTHARKNIQKLLSFLTIFPQLAIDYLSLPFDFIQSSSSLPQSCQSIPPTTLLTRLVLSPSPVICTLLSLPDSSFPPTSPIFSHLTFYQEEFLVLQGCLSSESADHGVQVIHVAVTAQDLWEGEREEVSRRNSKGGESE